MSLTATPGLLRQLSLGASVFIVYATLWGARSYAAPAIDPIPISVVPAGKSLILPLTASSPEGRALTYSVTSDSNDITPRLNSNNPYLKITVKEFGAMTFQLFADTAPVTTQAIVGLVNKGFYNGLRFHRIVNQFAIQCGSPSSDGKGGPGFVLDDEFNLDSIFSGSGQLAMANSGKDTGGSQFFITVGQQRALDFNYTIFGQLVRGFDVLRAINSTPTLKLKVIDAHGATIQESDTGTPLTGVIIEKAEMVPDTTDAVVTLVASPAATKGKISVKVDDGASPPSAVTFDVNVVKDTYDDPPFLDPVSGRTVNPGEPARWEMAARDIQGGPLEFAARPFISDSSQAKGFTYEVVGNVGTITPPSDFEGIMPVIIAVRRAGAGSRGSTPNPYDTQIVRLTVRVKLPGDMNADGKVNVADASVTLGIAVGLSRPTSRQQVAGDLNDDGRVDVKDALIILKRAVGL